MGPCRGHAGLPGGLAVPGEGWACFGMGWESGLVTPGLVTRHRVSRAGQRGPVEAQ